jgi:hypothetical protein
MQRTWQKQVSYEGSRKLARSGVIWLALVVDETQLKVFVCWRGVDERLSRMLLVVFVEAANQQGAVADAATRRSRSGRFCASELATITS